MKKEEKEKVFDYSRKHKHHLVVYFDDTRKSYQMIHPSVAFDGNWKALASHIGPYHSMEIR